MTETDWKTCRDPQPMLEFLRGKVSSRKLRLFSVACCRRLPECDTRDELDFAEQLADAKDGPEREDLDEQWTTWIALCLEGGEPVDWLMYAGPLSAQLADGGLPPEFTSSVAELATSDRRFGRRGTEAAELAAQAALLCDIFGPLAFRSIAFDPSWLSATVTSLAAAIYEERAFGRLPILADALEDAGCSSQEVLRHLRGGGEHCRGCWPVDLILGRK
jgi:hypothetical protein